MTFVRINKCASTSVAEMVRDCCIILQLTQLTPRSDRFGGWLDRERVKNDTCFTVIRNPYTRAVSMWQHCLRLGYEYDLYEWLVRDFTEMDPKERAHSLRQVDFLTDCFGRTDWIDFVFRMEDSRIEKKIQDVTGTKNTMRHLAEGNYPKVNLTNREKHMIGMKYHLDFKLGGYEK